MTQETLSAPAEQTPVWSVSRTYDTVVGGDEIFTLGKTGLAIRHWRGFFTVYLGDQCLGGIERVFAVSPTQYFLQNAIPCEGTLAQHHLGVTNVTYLADGGVCDNECMR